MPSKIHLRPEELHIVRTILRAHVPARRTRAFGSRVIGTPQPASNLDLCIMGEGRVPPPILERLRSAFSESTLPMKVHLVEWEDISDGLRRVIRNSGVVI